MNKKNFNFKPSDIQHTFRVKHTTPPIFFTDDECYANDIKQYNEELEIEAQKVKCKICGKVLPNKYKLAQHEINHSMTKCILCGRNIIKECYVNHLRKCRKNPRIRRKAEVLLECIKEDLDGENKENTNYKRARSERKNNKENYGNFITNYFPLTNLNKEN